MKAWYAAGVLLGLAAVSVIVSSPAAATVLIVMALAFFAGTTCVRLLRVAKPTRKIYLGGLLLRFAGTIVAYPIILQQYGGGDTLSYYRRGAAGASALLSGHWPQIRTFPGTGTVDFLSSVIQIVVPGPAIAVGVLFSLAGWLGCVLFCEAVALGTGERPRRLLTTVVMLLPRRMSRVPWNFGGGPCDVQAATSSSSHGAVTAPAT